MEKPRPVDAKGLPAEKATVQEEVTALTWKRAFIPGAIIPLFGHRFQVAPTQMYADALVLTYLGPGKKTLKARRGIKVAK